VSGEATPRPAPGPEALDRAFGSSARCNRCGDAAEEYRVIALFLHERALLRAYCRACYPAAIEGEYHARGDGALLEWDEYARRFGAPSPSPPRTTGADRTLAALLRVPGLSFLAPPSECHARRRGGPPYRVEAGFGQDGRALFLLAPDGTVTGLQGDEVACGRVRAALPG
jgi:hypothetical protein